MVLSEKLYLAPRQVWASPGKWAATGKSWNAGHWGPHLGKSRQVQASGRRRGEILEYRPLGASLRQVWASPGKFQKANKTKRFWHFRFAMFQKADKTWRFWHFGLVMFQKAYKTWRFSAFWIGDVPESL